MLTEKRIDKYADVKTLKIIGTLLIFLGLLNLIICIPIFGNENFSILIPFFIQIACGFIISFKCVGNAERASGYAGLCMSLDVLVSSWLVIFPMLDIITRITELPFSLIFTIILRFISVGAAMLLLICSIVCILEIAYNTYKVLVFTSICVGTEILTYIWMWHMGIGLQEVFLSITINLPSLVAYVTFILVMCRRNVLPPTQFRRTKMNSEWLSTTSRTSSDTVMFRSDLRKILGDKETNWELSEDPIEYELDVPLYRNKGFTHLLFLKYFDDEKIHMMVRIKNAKSYLNVFNLRIQDTHLNGTIDDCDKVRFYGETGMYVDIRVINFGEHKGGFVEKIKTRKIIKKTIAENKNVN